MRKVAIKPLKIQINTVGSTSGNSDKMTLTLPPTKSVKNLNGENAARKGESSTKTNERTNRKHPNNTDVNTAANHPVPRYVNRN